MAAKREGYDVGGFVRGRLTLYQSRHAAVYLLR